MKQPAGFKVLNKKKQWRSLNILTNMWRSWKPDVTVNLLVIWLILMRLWTECSLLNKTALLCWTPLFLSLHGVFGQVCVMADPYLKDHAPALGALPWRKGKRLLASGVRFHVPPDRPRTSPSPLPHRSSSHAPCWKGCARRRRWWQHSGAWAAIRCGGKHQVTLTLKLKQTNSKTQQHNTTPASSDKECRRTGNKDTESYNSTSTFSFQQITYRSRFLCFQVLEKSFGRLPIFLIGAVFRRYVIFFDITHISKSFYALKPLETLTLTETDAAWSFPEAWRW